MSGHRRTPLRLFFPPKHTATRLLFRGGEGAPAVDVAAAFVLHGVALELELWRAAAVDARVIGAAEAGAACLNHGQAAWLAGPAPEVDALDFEAVFAATGVAAIGHVALQHAAEQRRGRISAAGVAAQHDLGGAAGPVVCGESGEE